MSVNVSPVKYSDFECIKHFLVSKISYFMNMEPLKIEICSLCMHFTFQLGTRFDRDVKNG